jgi:RHS repeat-associated protein
MPFGQVRYLPGTPAITSTDFGYTGQRDLDSEIGLMDYKARFYSPLLGRFVQPDSLIPEASNPQAWNRYSYVVNRPINLNDPTGHCFTGAVVDTVICVTALAGIFFMFNGIGNDTHQPNLTDTELQSRQDSFNLGIGLWTSALSLKNPVIEKLADMGSCATDASSCMVSLSMPGQVPLHSSDGLITNTYPTSSKFVRLVPESIAEQIASGNYNLTLSHPNNADTFISAAEDLARYRTQTSVADRLALPTISTTERNALIGFNYDLNSGTIASPVNRTFAEFVGMGRTRGGAREWVIPNLLIKDLPISNIYIRWIK